MFTQVLADIPKYESFKFWFLPTSHDCGTWEIIDKETREVVGWADNAGCVSIENAEVDRSQVEEELRWFSLRPECSLADAVDVESLNQEELISAYSYKLLSITMIKAAKAGKDPDTNTRPAETCIDWLKTTDFYTAPGSTQYHDSEPAGLIRHSLRVFNHAMSLQTNVSFKDVPIESAALVALVHDWCKIGLYEMYMRNVKNEQTGKWEQVPSYKHNQRGVPLGHGVASMFLASKFFRLSTEESVAIRWHMSRWNVAENELNELQLANESFPLVHLIQFADCLSITKYGRYQIPAHE